jgi:hypothetical protein
MRVEEGNDPSLLHACVSDTSIPPPPNGRLQQEVQPALMQPVIIKMEEGVKEVQSDEVLEKVVVAV